MHDTTRYQLLHGPYTAPALRRALEGRPLSLELRRRIEGLLERLQGPITSGERLRLMRAVEVLGQAATPEARKLLEELAKGALHHRIRVMGCRQAEDAMASGEGKAPSSPETTDGVSHAASERPEQVPRRPGAG